jgi:hypothetical protein
MLNLHRMTSCTLLYSSSLPLYSDRLILSSGILFTYIDATRTRTYWEHITWVLSSQTIGGLAGLRENTCHVTATCCDLTSPRTHGKHIFPQCCLRVFRAWPRDDVLILLRVGTCLWSYRLAIRIHVTLYLLCCSVFLWSFPLFSLYFYYWVCVIYSIGSWYMTLSVRIFGRSRSRLWCPFLCLSYILQSLVLFRRFSVKI